MKKARPANKIGRKRRTLGWTLLTPGLLVAGVWVWSGSNEMTCTRGQSGLWLCFGVMDVSMTQQPDSRVSNGWKINSLERRGGWKWFAADHSLEPHVLSRVDLGIVAFERYKAVKYPEEFVAHRRFRVALWPIPFLLWTPAALLLRSGILARRRANTNACAQCGYSLAGLGGGGWGGVP